MTSKKQEEILTITDFDDTIFCRKDQLERSEILRNNRGNKGNEVIKNVIGIKNFMKMFYKGKIFPKNIISKMNPNKDLILTAGYEDIQKSKMAATGLGDFPIKVVLESKEKPFEMVKYIIEKLQFIPKEIHIYEDRPEYFIETKEEIENFLDTKIRIFLVEMQDNLLEPKIKELF